MVAYERFQYCKKINMIFSILEEYVINLIKLAIWLKVPHHNLKLLSSTGLRVVNI